MQNQSSHLAFFLRLLWQAAKHLGMPADEQISYLKKLGTPGIADELALEFDDAYRLLPQLVDTGLVTPSQAAGFDALDASLARISGTANSHLWTDEALRTAPQWQQIRRLANDLHGRE